jgi:RNA polymerase sigma-70 factor (ECF subfamily)
MSTPNSRDAGDEHPATGAGAPAGEDSAWIREHLEPVLRFARRRLPPEDAEDVAAEAFEALFAARRRGEDVRVPGAYLLGVARRRVADRLRRSAAGRVPVALPPGWEGFCDEALPDERAADRELAELVHVALGLLDPAERALLLARHRDGVPLALLGERTGLTSKAVELRLYRARAMLRELLLDAGAGWVEPLPRATPRPAATEGA